MEQYFQVENGSLTLEDYLKIIMIMDYKFLYMSLFFGLIGSYIRYLYKTAHLKNTHNALLRVKEEILEECKDKSLEEIQSKHLGITTRRIEKFVIDTGDFTLNEDGSSEISEEARIRAAKHILIIRKRRKVAFHQSLEDLSLFILSPLLSIVVWFFLSQGGVSEPLVLATVSFLIGLFTEQIMVTLRNFLGSTLKGIGENIEAEGRNADKEK